MQSRPANPRVNRIALARFEEWALPRMARRLPGWVTPDMLTAVGLLAAALICGAYLLSSLDLAWLWLASAGFVVHWWADSLDGTLARIRRIPRERYGFYVDHQADAAAALLIFGGLGFSALMPLPTALFVLAGYLLLMVHVSLVTIARGVFKISFGRFGPTEARLAMIAANSLVFFTGNPDLPVLGLHVTIFGLVGIAGGAVLLLTYLVSSLLERARLSRLDPPPAAGTIDPEPRDLHAAGEEPDGSA